MVDSGLRDESYGVEVDPLPEDDVVCHLMYLHLAFHLNVVDLQVLAIYTQHNKHTSSTWSMKDYRLTMHHGEKTETWRGEDRDIMGRRQRHGGEKTETWREEDRWREEDGDIMGRRQRHGGEKTETWRGDMEEKTETWREDKDMEGRSGSESRYRLEVQI